MKHKQLSRGPGIDTEKCVENAGGNKYTMVLIAAARAREIKRQHKESDKREHIFPTVTALEELQSGEIGLDYIRKIQ